MGAYLMAPHDVEPSAISLSRGAAFVAMDMVEPWHDLDLDYELVEARSFEQANEAVPWTLEGFLRWRREDAEITDPIWEDYEITRELFDTARDFVRECAQRSYSADWSP